MHPLSWCLIQKVSQHIVIHYFPHLAALTGMHTVVEARGLVPTDFALHINPSAGGLFSAQAKLL